MLCGLPGRHAVVSPPRLLDLMTRVHIIRLMVSPEPRPALT